MGLTFYRDAIQYFERIYTAEASDSKTDDANKKNQIQFKKNKIKNQTNFEKTVSGRCQDSWHPICID